MGVQVPCRVHTKIAQNVERKARSFLGHKLSARGYFVSTVRRYEEKIRADIKNQEVADQQLDQLHLKLTSSYVQSLIPESFITAFGGSPLKPPALLGGY
jgi:hypothetical protein